MTDVTTAFATTVRRGAEAAPCIWVTALAGDGTAIWVDTTAVTGAETGARAGVGTWTDDGSEAETGNGVELVDAAATETWGSGLTSTGDKAGRGTVAGATRGAGLTHCGWTWVWRAACPGTSGEHTVWVCAGGGPTGRADTWGWGTVWFWTGDEVRFCL